MKHDQAYSEQVQRVLQLAAAEARGLNHDFVGTEHLLLAIFSEGSSTAAHALEAMGADVRRVRAEIEKQVARGPQPVNARELPLTPRAKLALEFAAQEARMLQQEQINAEHLLLGLLREPDGVASLVARNLGVRQEELWQEVLGVRLEQMKLVERAVRPVRASRIQKRKMREELLSHLSSIYDEEHTRLGGSKAALEAASMRFGDPTELSKELGRAVPLGERCLCLVGRILPRRAPKESAVRYMARASGCLLVVMLVGVAAIIGLLAWSFSAGDEIPVKYAEPDNTLWIVILPVMIALALLLCVYTFLMGLLYIRMRDSLWGAFGTRRSTPAVLKYAIGIALAQIANPAFALGAVIEWSQQRGALPILLGLGMVGIFVAWFHYYIARKLGPEQISDSTWASLDIQTD